MNCRSVMAQSSATGTSMSSHDGSSSGSSRYADSDCGTKEAMLQRELDEAKARSSQMEKSMRWWSECTENWRDKCSKVRNERNQAREELKGLRNKLETVTINARKLEIQKDQLIRENKKTYDELDRRTEHFMAYNNVKTSKESSSNVGIQCNDVETEIEEHSLQGAVPKNAQELLGDSESLETNEEDQSENRHFQVDLSNDDFLIQKISMLHLRLEEATKTINAEREKNSSLLKSREKLKDEVSQLRKKYEMQGVKAEVIMDLMKMDVPLTVRTNELIALQDVTEYERSRQAKLETENKNLESENKPLRNQLLFLQESLETLRARTSSTYDTETKSLKQELIDRNKEMADLKQSYSKLKKVLAEKTTELSHSLRRSEQYEGEIKKVRGRIEELKRELTPSQDEVVALTNSIRRLQRTNEYLTEQLESANMRLDRFRNSNSDTRAPDVVAEIIDDKSRNDNDDNSDNDEDDNHEDDEDADKLLEGQISII